MPVLMWLIMVQAITAGIGDLLHGERDRGAGS